jgi:transposase
MLNSKQVKEMQAARKEGATYLELAQRFGVSISTVQRWTNPHAAEYQKKYQRDLYWERKADPVRHQEMLAKQRERGARYRQSLRVKKQDA